MKINDMNPLSGEIFIGLFLGLNKPILSMLAKKKYICSLNTANYTALHWPGAVACSCNPADGGHVSRTRVTSLIDLATRYDLQNDRVMLLLELKHTIWFRDVSMVAKKMKRASQSCEISVVHGTCAKRS